MRTQPGPDRGAALRLGLFGGTFDPPHVGHVAVARDVADALSLDRLVWVPAGIPPHKQGYSFSDGPLRLALVQAAIGDDARFDASDIELTRPGPSYTVDTLRQMVALYPEAELFLVLGSDQVRTLEHGWKEPAEVLRLATLVLMDREGETAPDVAPDLPGMDRAVHVPVSRVDISATAIRSAVADGRDVSQWVPPAVLEVIRREGLYQG